MTTKQNPAPQPNMRLTDEEIRAIAVKSFNEAIDADGYEPSYEIIENAIKTALVQTTLRKDNLNELVGAQSPRFGNSGLAYEGDEPAVVVELNGKMGGTDHSVSPTSSEESTLLATSPLSKVVAPQNYLGPVAYRHRLTGSTEWNVSNADDMDGVRECMRHLGDRLEVEPLFAAPPPSSHVIGRWLPIDQADKTITEVQDFPEVGMTIRTSDRYWVRDDDARVYEAAWSEGNNGRDYWWDFEGESPVDPVEFMPHPLDPRFATEGK